MVKLMVGASLSSQRLGQPALSDAFQEVPSPQGFSQTGNPRLLFQASCPVFSCKVEGGELSPEPFGLSRVRCLVPLDGDSLGPLPGIILCDQPRAPFCLSLDSTSSLI